MAGESVQMRVKPSRGFGDQGDGRVARRDALVGRSAASSALRFSPFADFDSPCRGEARGGVVDVMDLAVNAPFTLAFADALGGARAPCKRDGPASVVLVSVLRARIFPRPSVNGFGMGGALREADEILLVPVAVFSESRDRTCLSNKVSVPSEAYIDLSLFTP